MDLTSISVGVGILFAASDALCLNENKTPDKMIPRIPTIKPIHFIILKVLKMLLNENKTKKDCINVDVKIVFSGSIQLMLETRINFKYTYFGTNLTCFTKSLSRAAPSSTQNSG